jgi:tetratricopeptide (TPR) repeat protein
MSVAIHFILGAFVLGTGPLTMLGGAEVRETTEDNICEELRLSALAHAVNGRLKEAKALLSGALADDRRECVGPVLTGLAANALVSGRMAEAGRFAESSIKVLEIERGLNDPSLLRPLRFLSAISFEQGQIGKSQRMFQRMLQIRAQRPEHRAVVHSTAAMLLRHQGKLKEAESEIVAAIQAWEETGRTNGADYASLLGGLAALYIEQRKYAEAGPLLDRAFSIIAAAKDSAPMDQIHTLHVRAALHAREGQWRQSEEKFVEALKMAEQDTHADQPVLRALLTNYAIVLRKTHRGREARSLEKRAATLPAFPSTNALVDVTELLRDAKPAKR